MTEKYGGIGSDPHIEKIGVSGPHNKKRKWVPSGVSHTEEELNGVPDPRTEKVGSPTPEQHKTVRDPHT